MRNKSALYKKFMTTAAAAAVVTSAAAPWAAAVNPFTDVPERYQEAVEFLISTGAKGTTASSFGTYENIKRVDAAVLLANVLGLDIENAADSGFKDVPERAVGAVNALKEAGITNGKSTESFGAQDLITRGELAIWIQKGFDLQEKTTLPFTDVSERYEQAVQALLAHEITQGISKTEFGVHQPAKRGDYAVFLYKAFQAQDNDNFELSIMHTNDTHANVDKVAKKVTAIKEVRAEKPDALLIDAGDVFSGTLYFNEFHGQADLEFMNYVGYDVMTFGNHEFDLGSTPEGHKGLADFISGASFPFVSANIDFTGDSDLAGLFKNEITDKPEEGTIYNGIIKEVEGEKVGIFGLTTEETVDLSSPGSVQFENYIEEAENTVAAFEAEGVNKIVAVTHLGFDDNPEKDNDQLLAEYVDGIDVIVGGHSHTKLDEPVVVAEDENGAAKDPTVIVQAYQYNDYLGTLDVEFDENGRVVGQAGELIKIADKEEDAVAAEMLKEYSDVIAEVKNTSTGAETAVELPNPRLSDEGATVSVRNSETALGNLITDGMLDKAKEYNPDTVIALQNGGGIRAAIDKGDITLGDVLTVLPFGNTLATMELTGAQIVEALEHSVSQAPKESGGFLHVSGMKFTYDSSKAAGSRVVAVEVKNENSTYTALDPEASYAVATNAFTAKGGDGYDVFKEVYEQGLVTDLGYADWENLRDYVAKLKTVNPQIEDRIVDVNKK
ncbi:5'-nucleotidase C-terminal domain-containing protein [Niallia oryzisoli]|uniref:5'-nucleotidase C-terminal domain-containing protein n=1 Tax=Niallia oryzisoli TaxID=1737571 RepID=A0ABZ2CAA3_9BACI